MKRSEINKILVRADEFIRERGFYLPPFANFAPEKWKSLGSECDEIRDNMLGWDITDFGLGDFSKAGLTLFTIRNGNLKDSRYSKQYAEKLLISEPGQVCPCHFHYSKMEDIINRGGGTLAMRLWNAGRDGNRSSEPLEIVTDGCRKTISAGETIRLNAGESITLYPYQYHEFWAEGSRCLIGEVSSVNDDNTDNRFYKGVNRFPKIEEDEEPLYLLCNEYPKL